MTNIALLGQIQHEFELSQLKQLIDSIKADMGFDGLIFCNASGLFANATALENKVEQLFRSGIDVIFLGEAAIYRAVARNILTNTDLTIIRPINLSDSAPGKGVKLVNFGSESFWLISILDHSGRLPVEPAHIKLEEFFRSKRDEHQVFINVNGTNLHYKDSLFWWLRRMNFKATIFGNGLGYPLLISKSIDGVDIEFLLDTGSVEAVNSIAGATPELWWQKNIEKKNTSFLPDWGTLKADYTILFDKQEKKMQNCLHKSVKI